MKIETVIKGDIEPEVRKKLWCLLKPVLSIGNPGKCLFCDTLTSWTINNKPVCPACTVKYGFIKKDRIPDPCEVCGRQGEWCTEGGEHSLCWSHRDAWFNWKNPKLDYIRRDTTPEEWHQIWEEGWKSFIDFFKENEYKGRAVS